MACGNASTSKSVETTRKATAAAAPISANGAHVRIALGDRVPGAQQHAQHHPDERDQAEHAHLDQAVEELGVEDPVAEVVVAAPAAAEQQVAPHVGTDRVVVRRAVAHGRDAQRARLELRRRHPERARREDRGSGPAARAPAAPASAARGGGSRRRVAITESGASSALLRNVANAAESRSRREAVQDAIAPARGVQRRHEGDRQRHGEHRHGLERDAAGPADDPAADVVDGARVGGATLKIAGSSLSEQS